jgi:hypothetical protein
VLLVTGEGKTLPKRAEVPGTEQKAKTGYRSVKLRCCSLPGRMESGCEYTYIITKKASAITKRASAQNIKNHAGRRTEKRRMNSGKQCIN